VERLHPTIAVYLVVLNKLRICAINAPLLLLSTGEKLTEFCQWLVTEAKGLTIEEQVAYRTLIITYNIVENEEVKKQMGRKVWKPDYDRLAGYLREDMPPEIKIKFIQSLLHADSPEMSVQRILEVDSLDEAILKLVEAKEQQKEKNGG